MNKGTHVGFSPGQVAVDSKQLIPPGTDAGFRRGGSLRRGILFTLIGKGCGTDNSDRVTRLKDLRTLVRHP